MNLTIPAFANGDRIPEKYAFAKIDAENHTSPSNNLNPQIIWSDLPEGTQSLALICVDDKVPAEFDDANLPDKTISKDMARINFYHWVLIDIDPLRGEIKEGEDSDGITNGGKEPGKKAHGITGINNYSDNNGGYDGPCPPWNDELMHEYHFQLFALDIPSLNLAGKFTAADVLAAMEGHVLGKADWMGAYSLNPSLTK